MVQTRMMNDDPYFAWLCSKAHIGEQYGKPYYRLASELHEQKFSIRHLLPMDCNRLNDGLSVRARFWSKYGEAGSASNRGAPTMLEFLIGLAERMSFLMGDESEPSRTAEYFWHLIRNLRLLKLNDEDYDMLHGDLAVEDAVYRVLNRQYGADGDGGLFPLRNAQADQRGVDIWYQMQQWLREHGGVVFD